MKRNLTFEEISDGHKYTAEDMVKVSCQDCKGCFECCKVTDDTIHLDPYDIFELSKGLNSNFTKMLNDGIINLTVVDGVITPYLCKKPDTHTCSFLSDEGRCLIHDFRPGFCRLFPLGRIYDDSGDFKYFIQVHECPYPNKTKIKVKKWLGIPNLSKYEQFIRDWHRIVKNISDCALENPDAAKSANMQILETYFVSCPDSGDFFAWFSKTGFLP